MWINFRASREANTIYWSASDAPVNGDDRLNIEVADVVAFSPEAVERLIASATSAELCYACPGATVQLNNPWGGVAYHDENCQAYFGWTVRDQAWTPRNLTPEPAPETPTP